jgi:hypothetical protein
MKVNTNPDIKDKYYFIDNDERLRKWDEALEKGKKTVFTTRREVTEDGRVIWIPWR